MPGSTFQTNPVSLHEMLKQCHDGRLQLPDFQRSWVWDEERIQGLIASISRAFPVGALMTLRTGGEIKFQPRAVEGAPQTVRPGDAQALLLDGQQRMTSMYQVALRGEVVETRTVKNKRKKVWFYLDITKCLDPDADRVDAVVTIPPDRIVRKNFDRDVVLDLSSPDREYEALMFPVAEMFRWGNWFMGFIQHAGARPDFVLMSSTVQRFEVQSPWPTRSGPVRC